MSLELIVAARARVPMVVFAGDTALDDPHGVQQFDLAKFVDATEAGFVAIWKASEAEDAVRTAFYRARSVPPDCAECADGRSGGGVRR